MNTPLTIKSQPEKSTTTFMSNTITTTNNPLLAELPAELKKDNIALHLSLTYLDTVQTWKGTKPTDKDKVNFLLQSISYNLNPIKKQCYLLPYEGNTGASFTFAVSIGGLTSIASRTGQYAGRDQARFNYIDDKLESCSVTVYRIVSNLRCGFTATAYYSERVGKKKDGSLTEFWLKQPKTMLEKCAFATALRSAFPDELSGAYSEEELPPTTTTVEATAKTPEIDYISDAQLKKLLKDVLPSLAQIKAITVEDLQSQICERWKVGTITELSKQQANSTIEKGLAKIKEIQEGLSSDSEVVENTTQVSKDELYPNTVEPTKV